jgi:hypothetical protein
MFNVTLLLHIEIFTANHIILRNFHAKIKDFFIKFLLFQDKNVLLLTELDNSKQRPLWPIANQQAIHWKIVLNSLWRLMLHCIMGALLTPHQRVTVPDSLPVRSPLPMQGMWGAGKVVLLINSDLIKIKINVK